MSPKHVLTKVQKIALQNDDIDADLNPRANELDTGCRKDFENCTNIMGDKDTPLKLGVLELSTRACKVLVVDIRRLQYGFRWAAVQNRAHITELGHLINQDNEIPWIDFERLVLPKIEHALSFMKDEKVDVFHCVATAALRTAQNRDEISNRLKETLNLNVQILDSAQEADATFAGYRWYPAHDLTDNTVLVDQGGGSTEINIFMKDERKLSIVDPQGHRQSTNIPVGTTTAVQYFLQHTEFETSMQNALNNDTSYLSELNKGTVPLQNLNVSRLIGVGTAITKATNKPSNKIQHGIELIKGNLEQQQLEMAQELIAKFPHFGDYKTALNEFPIGSQGYTQFREQLVKYFGIKMVLYIMDRLNCPSLTVNGLGLRYGICHQMIQTYYPDLESGVYQSRFESKSLTGNGVTECTYVNGIMNNSTHFGIFVRLPNNENGLLHKSKYAHIHDLRFEYGKPLRVYIQRIYNKNGRRLYDLSL